MQQSAEMNNLLYRIHFNHISALETDPRRLFIRSVCPWQLHSPQALWISSSVICEELAGFVQSEGLELWEGRACETGEIIVFAGLSSFLLVAGCSEAQCFHRAAGQPIYGAPGPGPKINNIVYEWWMDRTGMAVKFQAIGSLFYL